MAPHLVPRREQAPVRRFEAGAVVGGGPQGVGVDEEDAARGVVGGSDGVGVCVWMGSVID